MTTEKNKVSELLVSDEQLLGPRHDAIGEDDFYPERMSYWAIRAIYEAELARLRQERDELVGALREEYERLERECNEDDARERGSSWVRYYRDFQGFLMDKIHMHKPE